MSIETFKREVYEKIVDTLFKLGYCRDEFEIYLYEHTDSTPYVQGSICIYMTKWDDLRGFYVYADKTVGIYIGINNDNVPFSIASLSAAIANLREQFIAETKYNSCIICGRLTTNKWNECDECYAKRINNQ